MNTIHLKWFHWHRHEKIKNSDFDSIDYSKWSKDDLVKKSIESKK
jgi:hypothetical protein